MKESAVAKSLPVGLAITGVVLLYFWLSANPAKDLQKRLPGEDDRKKAVVDADEPVKITGQLTKYDGKPADLPGAWPRFRGPNFDAISTNENVKLARSWPQSGPNVVWSIDVGEGYAGAAVLAGRVYMLDYDQEKKEDVVRCLSLADGRDIWRYAYNVKIKRFHGMSRTVPAVTEKHVVTIGPKCHVTCLDSMTGQFKWMLNLVREYGTKVPQWYTAQCPLIEDGRVIIAPAGDEVLMMAVDAETGQTVWTTPNPDGWVMTHSSIVPMEFNDKRFYIYCGGNTSSGGVVGVSAEDGSVLWKNTDWKVRTNVPSPVIVGDDRIFLSAGYGQYENGCMMLRLKESDGNITAEEEFIYPTEVFGSMQQTPIFFRDHIYGVGMDKQLACLDPTGKVLWTSTSAKKFGYGAYMIANGLMYVLNDSGVLTLVEPSPADYVELQSDDVIEGHESWGPMAMASGRLIIRNLTRMMCLDVTEQ
jgi:outer membrane protein assembly factor BamB